MVNKILFITLSNIGDVILTLPVLDFLRKNFPQGQITIMVGPGPKEIFENNPYIHRLIVYDKHSRLRDKIRLFRELSKENFDVIIDLRNSFFGALLPARYKISPFRFVPRDIKHMKDRHLYRLSVIGYRLSDKERPPASRTSIYISPQDEEYIEGILRDNKISHKDTIAVIAAGAKSHIKKWPSEKFAELINRLIEEFSFKVILIGDKHDIPVNEYVSSRVKHPVLDLTAKTTLAQTACLIKISELIITGDSACLHLAGYLEKPAVAIFGPTDDAKYGPWSDKAIVVKKEIFCRPCQKAQCRFKTLECMHLVKVEDVLRAVNDLLTGHRSQVTGLKENFKRILIVRTDRIGDVVLSTPVIKALRQAYPYAYIAMMVSPYTKEIVEGNPFLDQVVIFDKEKKHRSWLGTLKFAGSLAKKRFDLAIILHPTNRVHLVCFLAGIPRRIGYDRKLGILLTDRIKHLKQEGEKHELEYSLDLLKYLNIEATDKELFMPVTAEVVVWVRDLFSRVGIRDSDRLVAIHPSASCPSRLWPIQRFAEVADKLIERYKFKVLVVAGPKDIALARDMIKKMNHPAVNLAGRTSLTQLAAVFKKCVLFISNDSGPAHIASSTGTPVISIFGRNQKGLSPLRWGPTGRNDRALHKEVGCVECLAHNCVKGFACLKAITVDDVLKAADSILQKILLKHIEKPVTKGYNY
jgi:heptosyltransferase II